MNEKDPPMEQRTAQTRFRCAIWQSLVDDPEDTGQGQKSFHTTQLLLVVNICTKREKDPSSGRKVTALT